MRRNSGKETKKVTLIVPESTEVMDITYYWKTASGISTKTVVVLTDRALDDGNEIVSYRFPFEEDLQSDEEYDTGRDQKSD